MELGGRRAVYELMEMAPPALAGPPPKKSAPKLVIDRDGKEDKARYSGLKMGQVLNDDVMAEALMKAGGKLTTQPTEILITPISASVDVRRVSHEEQLQTKSLQKRGQS